MSSANPASAESFGWPLHLERTGPPIVVGRRLPTHGLASVDLALTYLRATGDPRPRTVEFMPSGTPHQLLVAEYGQTSVYTTTVERATMITAITLACGDTVEVPRVLFGAEAAKHRGR